MIVLCPPVHIGQFYLVIIKQQQLQQQQQQQKQKPFRKISKTMQSYYAIYKVFPMPYRETNTKDLKACLKVRDYTVQATTPIHERARKTIFKEN